LRVGILDEFDVDELDTESLHAMNLTKEILQSKGATLVPLSIPLTKYAVPFHFTLIPSECASNLARFDGLKYGFQPA